MDTPILNTIKIGNVTVGLIGLDMALVQLADMDLSEDEAVDFLLQEVNRKNYVPSQAVKTYKEALRREYRRYHNLDTPEEEGMTIRILGRPCIVCNKLKLLLIDILQEKNIAADIEDVQDLDEIWRYGVTKTPALIINGELKSAGIQPSRIQLEKWLEEAARKE